MPLLTMELDEWIRKCFARKIQSHRPIVRWHCRGSEIGTGPPSAARLWRLRHAKSVRPGPVCVCVLQQFRSRRWCTPPRHSAICETRQSDQRKQTKNKNTVRLLVDLLCVAPIHSCCSAGVCMYTPTGEQIRKWKPWKFFLFFSSQTNWLDPG